jgi:uncharacterized ParB-like nuclease family protein
MRLSSVQAGEPVLPVFIEEGDTTHFIMGGRHRIVAFIQSGLSEIPVALVTKNPELTLNLGHQVMPES